jgi:tetratricopeptide (TPR) repeat protein
LAADQYDLLLASQQLAVARQLSEQACNHDLLAEIQHVEAMIDLAQDRYLHTAAHLDREATLLRRAGSYRKLPDVLKLSGVAYQRAAEFDLAADRLCRAARIWLTRGELKKSWELLQQALVCSESAVKPWTPVRLRLTAQEIEAAAIQNDVTLQNDGKRQNDGLEQEPDPEWDTDNINPMDLQPPAGIQRDALQPMIESGLSTQPTVST